MRVSHFRPIQGLGYNPATNAVKQTFDSKDASIEGLFDVGGAVYVFAIDHAGEELVCGKYSVCGIVTIRGEAAEKLLAEFSKKWPDE